MLTDDSSLIRRAFFQPSLVLRFLHHHQVALHLVMSQATEFCAGNFILACLERLEMHWYCQARNSVLLKAQGRNKKTMSDILGAENHLDRLVYRNGHTSDTNNVVLRGRIFCVKTDRVFLVVHQLWISPAKLAVRSRITNIPNELLAGHFNLNRVWRCILKVELCPHPLPEGCQADKDNRYDQHHPDFEFRVAMRVDDLTLSSIAVAPNVPTQGHLRRDKCN